RVRRGRVAHPDGRVARTDVGRAWPSVRKPCPSRAYIPLRGVPSYAPSHAPRVTEPSRRSASRLSLKRSLQLTAARHERFSIHADGFDSKQTRLDRPNLLN